MDILCADCDTKLGEVVDGTTKNDLSLHHRCFECGMADMGIDCFEWLHLENQPENIGRMQPITTLSVVKRGPFDDVIDADVDLTVTLCHEDLRDDPVPMMMGNTARKMIAGRAIIDSLYVRGTGQFCLKIEATGHDPLYTHTFKVT